MSKYNISYWHSKLTQCFSGFVTLYNYAQNNEAIREHVNSFEITDIGTKGETIIPITSIDEEGQNFFIDTTTKSIESALLIFSDQMIVVFVSIMDSMLSELIQHMFINSTESFFNILKDEENKPIFKIDLTDIVKAQTREQILENHAVKISSQILSGKIEKQIKRIEKISNCTIADGTKNTIIGLYDLRNKIVHELKQSNTTTKQIDSYYEACHALIDETGKILEEMNIAFDDPQGIAFRELFKEAEELLKKNE